MVEKFKKSLLVVAVLLGVFAVLMIFCPVVMMDFEEVIGMEVGFGIDGLKSTFGWESKMKEYDGYGSVTYDFEMLEFSFWHLLMFALPLVGVFALWYSVSDNNNKNAVYFAVLCFLVAAVLFFLSKTTLQFAEKGAKDEVEEYLSLGAGAIMGGISCLLAALCSYLHIKD